jgi:hypothetical protein
MTCTRQPGPGLGKCPCVLASGALASSDGPSLANILSLVSVIGLVLLPAIFAKKPCRIHNMVHNVPRTNARRTETDSGHDCEAVKLVASSFFLVKIYQRSSCHKTVYVSDYVVTQLMSLHSSTVQRHTDYTTVVCEQLQEPEHPHAPRSPGETGLYVKFLILSFASPLCCGWLDELV